MHVHMTFVCMCTCVLLVNKLSCHMKSGLLRPSLPEPIQLIVPIWQHHKHHPTEHPDFTVDIGLTLELCVNLWMSLVIVVAKQHLQ